MANISILKNGKAANGIIRFENKAYEYVELNFDGEIIRILKNGWRGKNV